MTNRKKYCGITSAQISGSTQNEGFKPESGLGVIRKPFSDNLSLIQWSADLCRTETFRLVQLKELINLCNLRTEIHRIIEAKLD